MISSAFELGEQMNSRTLPYILYHPLWIKHTFPNIDLKFSNWSTIKYLSSDGKRFSSEINTVPNNKGGLYLFYIKCQIICGITEYPFYLGRAQLTKGQNLRKRVKEYFSKYAREDERPKITKMFKYWGSELHLAYIVLEDNEDIIDLEKKLINSLLLPMNDEIPDQEIKQAKKAFEL